MKVAFYNHTSDISGAEISMMTAASHMTRATPTVYAPPGELLHRASSAGIAVSPVESYRARMSRNPLRLLKDMLGMMGAGLRFARQVRRSDVDIVHANSLRAGMMASLFGWLHRRPVLWHVRDIPPKGLIGLGTNLLAATAAAGVICISAPVAAPFSRRLLRNKLRLVYNGVQYRLVSDTERFSFRHALRSELNTPVDSAVMVIIGQIAPWKRQQDAVIAAARLIESGHDLYLWVVGEPKFRQENEVYYADLQALAGQLGILQRVRFTGFREDVTEVICASDLLVLCSDNEPFGRVVIEGMAQQVPVVATRSGGVPEIIEDGINGLLYEVGDVTRLVKHASRLLSDTEYSREIGRAGAERVSRHFTAQGTTKQVEEIYEAILDKRKPWASRGRLADEELSHGSRLASETLPVAASREFGTSALRIAIVHDYLNQAGGAERVVAVLHRMFPDAPIYTTIADRNSLLPELRDADIRTTWMQRIPGIMKRYKLFFWLYPFAIASMRLRAYDVVVSSSSAYGIGASVRRDALHVCYCHTPMRFAWNFASYMQEMQVPAVIKAGARLLTVPLKQWDRAAAGKVDLLIANSTTVQGRIGQTYNKESMLLHPPVDIQRFELSSAAPDSPFLVVSRLVSYKRIDLAVEACTRANLPLLIIGTGPDQERLERLAGPGVRFLGRLSDERVVQYMQTCRALIFPGLEDFGITPLEANACGRPVIAYRGGGALDTIVPGVNGVFFEQQTVESLVETLNGFDAEQFDPHAARSRAEKFNEQRFVGELSRMIDYAIARKNQLPLVEASSG
ncbi:glycosyltransferase [Paenibacillaceae bacterium]|nr:glycosyltransferase [Paenibacillaceae bacterium]